MTWTCMLAGVVRRRRSNVRARAYVRCLVLVCCIIRLYRVPCVSCICSTGELECVKNKVLLLYNKTKCLVYI